MQEKPKLVLDWATHQSAKYACENWHYSRCIPVNKLLKIGVWEDDMFKGVIIYGLGTSAFSHIQYNLKREEVCELVRIALNSHYYPVSKMIATSFLFLKKKCPNIKLVTSFADPYQGHHGGIYQATNWIYAGNSAKVKEYFFNGRWRHVTDIYKRLSSDEIKKLEVRDKPPKYKYLMPLDKKIRKQILPLSKPYPKRENNAGVV